MKCPECAHEFTSKRPLAPRVAEALTFLVEGYANKEIACEMNLAERTIKAYVQAAMRFYGAKNRVALAVIVYGENLKKAKEATIHAA